MKTCPFCSRREAGDFIQVTTQVMQFEPLNPVTPGHMLFMPKRHVEHEDTVGHLAVGDAMKAAQFYAVTRREEFNLITSCGSAATQTVPHIHVHYVPRRKGDGLALPWT